MVEQPDLEAGIGNDDRKRSKSAKMSAGVTDWLAIMVSCKNDFFIAYAHKKISLPESVNLSFIWRGPAEGELPVIGMKKCFPV